MGTRSIASVKFTAGLTGSVRNTLTDGTVASASIGLTLSQAFAQGVSAQQADRAWQVKQLDIVAAATLVIDLFDFAGMDIGAGAGNDQVGQTMSPIHEVAVIAFKNENAIGAAGQLEIEPDATNGWTPIGSHTVALGGALRGQGFFVKMQPAEEGFPVVDTTSHRIKLTASGGDVSFSMYLIGRSDTEESSSSSSSISSLSSSSSSSLSSASSVSSSSSSSSFSSSSSSHSSSSISSLSSSSSSVSTSSSSISLSSTSSSSWSSRSSSPSSISESTSSSSSSSISSSSFSSSIL